MGGILGVGDNHPYATRVTTRGTLAAARIFDETLTIQEHAADIEPAVEDAVAAFGAAIDRTETPSRAMPSRRQSSIFLILSVAIPDSNGLTK